MSKGSTAKNNNLHAAKRAKNDEFYTPLAAIENELKHYKDYFKGKIILCNCDDPLESNFVKYFSLNFEHLGLKKLIATHYKESNLFTTEAPYKLEYTGDKNGNNMPDMHEFVTEMLDSDGDFRSPECESLLLEADIVVTNPPFSLFREYVDQLTLFEKDFLIIGPTNAITYKEIFPLIKNNQLWWGVSPRNMEFIMPDGSLKAVNSVWFTNLPHDKRNEKITLYKKYSKKEYPTYDNYDAINVNKVVDIPMDYEGVMGVPITFLGKYNPEQFEILGQMANTKVDENNFGYPFLNGDRKYARILIRNREVEK